MSEFEQEVASLITLVEEACRDAYGPNYDIGDGNRAACRRATEKAWAEYVE